MSSLQNEPAITGAEIILPAPEWQATVDFFLNTLGFQLDSIAPADDPVSAQLSGYGLRLCLDREYLGSAASLRLYSETEKPELTAPNGTRIQFGPAQPSMVLPTLEPSLSIQRLEDNDSKWNTGRAGMQYRDLIPDRQGGRFIASHIRIPKGGPVPDDVHYHDIRFQMIYCYRGWVKLVYEDQGEPFIMRAGDCVLQPPMIRHRVLEASDGLEVIEIGCPADHTTYLDHKMALPTRQNLPKRDYGGQRYHFYNASNAVWRDHNLSGLAASHLGLANATGGLAEARVLRCTGSVQKSEALMTHDKELAFWFVLQGKLELQLRQQPNLSLFTGDAVVIPAGMHFALQQFSADMELLQVSLPG